VVGLQSVCAAILPDVSPLPPGWRPGSGSGVTEYPSPSSTRSNILASGRIRIRISRNAVRDYTRCATMGWGWGWGENRTADGVEAKVAAYKFAGSAIDPAIRRRLLPAEVKCDRRRAQPNTAELCGARRTDVGGAGGIGVRVGVKREAKMSDGGETPSGGTRVPFGAPAEQCGERRESGCGDRSTPGSCHTIGSQNAVFEWRHARTISTVTRKPRGLAPSDSPVCARISVGVATVRTAVLRARDRNFVDIR